MSIFVTFTKCLIVALFLNVSIVPADAQGRCPRTCIPRTRAFVRSVCNRFPNCRVRRCNTAFRSFRCAPFPSTSPSPSSSTSASSTPTMTPTPSISSTPSQTASTSPTISTPPSSTPSNSPACYITSSVNVNYVYLRCMCGGIETYYKRQTIFNKGSCVKQCLLDHETLATACENGTMDDLAMTSLIKQDCCFDTCNGSWWSSYCY